MTSTYVTERDQLVAARPDEHTLEDNFRRFHAENPHVYDTLVELAHEWRRRRPGQLCGMGMLFEIARWRLNISTVGEPVALNNNYRAFYARLIMDREPGMEGIFETRRQRVAPLSEPAVREDRERPTTPAFSSSTQAAGSLSGDATDTDRGGVAALTNLGEAAPPTPNEARLAADPGLQLAIEETDA